MQKLGPKHRMCRRVGEAVCGRPNCPVGKRPYPPGQHGQGRRRLSEFHIRLLEKQKLRAMYGVQEKQFRKYFAGASRKKGVTGEELLRTLETRLDAVVLRLGFGQTVSASASAKNFVSVREAMEVMPDPPPYLERDKDAVSGRLVRLPERSEIPLTVTVDERLIVELMS